MNTAPYNPDARDPQALHDQVLDEQLQAVLEHKPAVFMSPDFAARVAVQAAAQRLPKPRRTFSYGHIAAVLSAALLLLTMFALVPWTQASFNSIAFDIELLAAAQLVAIAWWLTTRRCA